MTSTHDLPPSVHAADRFTDRRDAGRRLALLLAPYRREHPVVVGVARGGVVVAAAVARALRSPLDVIAVQKFATAADPGVYVTAAAPGVMLRDDCSLTADAVAPRYLAFGAAHAAANVNERMALYRGRRSTVPLQGATVILVDDIMVTGMTVTIAAMSIRRHEPTRLIVAAPLATPAAVRRVAALADEVVTAETMESPGDPRAVYRTFDPVLDSEVVDLLRRAPP